MIFMIPVKSSFHSDSHRFVSFNNTSILGLAFSLSAAGSLRGYLLVFCNALLLASELPTVYERLSL